MMAFDPGGLVLGLSMGAIMSVVFFAGLGWGMKIALRAANPVTLLLLSAALRIAALLGVGWLVVAQGGPWALLGFALVFVCVRFAAITIARMAPAERNRP
ncbi:N-ATPase subunit AtpR [Yoonia sediminilitoris]|uniref:F1-F0 ATPase (N-ATPase) AtpR subunit n=1 Tax=Yoonia sediminilitoris TaxID=1286148 RepID=A0A2T6KJU1_9RHOB|nr:ATP synthase subunit I [Yoonia sediminilitoris]PUB16192.1 F1-F0 ATPase (N-ATPase) AtpR subunit [Yoonia sediminilitoris]RCW96541.1 F1-F0 ATPase (N-ATPase) AtpR subunit [Yoonia sediminilitoris]